MSQLENTIRRAGAIRGLFLGVILLALSIISYYVLIYNTQNAWLILISPVIFSVVIPIIIVLIFCFNLRKRIGGYWTFRQAVTGIFIMFAVNYVIQVAGKDVVFAKFIEPDMIPKTEAAMMKGTEVMLKKTGASQAAIAQKKAEIQKKLDEQKDITTRAIIQGYVITLLLLFALALIFAALLKRNRPEYQSYNDGAG
ncbi:MAG TPA: DUF4199 domain-containing protein [Mucilaginibacter sp.]|jgi:heme/copper-type cytochrome/quinol oxidase subunit 4|nr:DUF4199 domain-containing protein [Mucilaginibacter sp.]